MRSITDSEGNSHEIVQGRLIPSPDVPNHPVLSTQALFQRIRSATPSILDSGHHVEVTSGRYAIALAAEIINFRDGDEILLPAYHCSSMIDPMLNVGARPVFYKINRDLSVNLEHLKQQVGTQTRALLAVNYFGFPQNLQVLRDFCDDEGILLIEDCAHCFFGASNGRPVGSYGDFAIGSYWKFFPVLDGGCLVIRDDSLATPGVEAQSPYVDLKTVYNTLEHAINYNRMWLLQPAFMALETFRTLFRRDGVKLRTNVSEWPADEDIHYVEDDGFEFDAERTHLAMTRTSQTLISCLSFGRAIERRRENYRAFLRALDSLSNGRPLIKDLADGVVPYVFPLYLDDMRSVFPRLEDAAVPMQRFGQFLYEGVTPDLCPVTDDFSKNVIQLPCHQELTDNEIDSIVQRTRDIVG